MAVIVRGEIWRGEDKIGTLDLDEEIIYDERGDKIGSYDRDTRSIYDSQGYEIGYIKDNYIYHSRTNEFFGYLDENFERVSRGDSYYSPLCCAAVSMLLGAD